MYIVVLLIHPRKGLNVFAATSHSSITHFFVSKNLNIIYSKKKTNYTEILLQCFINWKIYTITIRNLYISEYCRLWTCARFVAKRVRILCVFTYNWTSTLHAGKWRTLHSTRGNISRDSWRVGDCGCARTTGLRDAWNCTQRLQSMHRPSHHSMRGKIFDVPNRGGTVELLDPLKQCGSPAIVLWVCNPYSEGSGIPWRGGSSLEGARPWLKSCAVLTGALTNTGPDEEK